MTPSSLDLFVDQVQLGTAGDAATETRAAPAPMSTFTASGQPTEWGFIALEAVFEKRKGYAKTLDAPMRAALTKALWDYALARHEALLSHRPAGDAAPALLGHRSLDDKLNQALRVLAQHGVDPSDIPAARAFAPADLRHIAGESPFPIIDSNVEQS